MGNRIWGFISLLGGAVWLLVPQLFSKFTEAIFFDRVLRMLNPYLDSISLEVLWRYGPTVALVGLGLYLLLRRPKSLIEVFGQKFQSTTVALDGKNFHDCTFENVTFRWDGGNFGIIRGTIVGTRRIETFNRQVVSSIDLLQALNFLDPSFSADWKHVPLADRPTSRK
jgi:hypothetical protein